uniref:Uncharacterized protein n=1 Tax=Anguilla anguilla TaxID=7936 RepID=A0A0E9WDJ0_ANGAN
MSHLLNLLQTHEILSKSGKGTCLKTIIKEMWDKRRCYHSES